MRLPIIFMISLFLLSSRVGAQEAQAPIPVEAPQRSVSLKAKIVQIVLNDEHRQGVDWEAIVSDFHTLQLKKEGLVSWSDKKFTLSVGEVSDDDYEVLLEALDTVGHVSQRDIPVLTLLKNELKIQDIPIDSKTLSSIQLEVLWVNSPSGESKLRMTPSMRVIVKEGGFSSAITTFKDETELDLSDHKTIVMGGLMQEDEITKIRKFPLLGDLPLVGLVFRKQGRLMQKTETMIFLTVQMNEAVTPVEEQK